MRVDSKATVAGYPILLVRQALRKLREVDVWGSAMLDAAAGLPAGAGPELAKEPRHPGIDPEASARHLDDASGGHDIHGRHCLQTADARHGRTGLAAFMERVVRVHSAPYYLGRVARVALFGSMLNPDTDRPSDVDLAVEIIPKVADWDSHVEKNNERVSALVTLGHRFRHTIEYAACWHLEAFRFLKSGRRAISLVQTSRSV